MSEYDTYLHHSVEGSMRGPSGARRYTRKDLARSERRLGDLEINGKAHDVAKDLMAMTVERTDQYQRVSREELRSIIERLEALCN